MEIDLLVQPLSQQRIGDLLALHLESSHWSHFRAAVAFAKRSGTKHIRSPLKDFFNRGGKGTLSVGIDANGTSSEALEDLLDATSGVAGLYVFHNLAHSTFHPKVYFFRNPERGLVIVGSNNMTEGGLYTNYEAALRVGLDLQLPSDLVLADQVERELDYWSTPHEGLCLPLTGETLAALRESSLVLPEPQMPRDRPSSPSPESDAPDSPAITLPAARLFRATSVPPAPRHTSLSPDPLSVFEPSIERRAVATPPANGAHAAPAQAFLMTLQTTDVGVGQLTAGTSRRSPEIFIPLAARDYDPEFWGWPSLFTPDPRNPGKMDRPGVRVRMGHDVLLVNMMTWPQKHDFRLRSEALRSAGNVGDILYLERTEGRGDFIYYAEIIPVGTVRHEAYRQLCTSLVRSSQKRWGYVTSRPSRTT